LSVVEPAMGLQSRDEERERVLGDILFDGGDSKAGILRPDPKIW
jgi:hypothetical protein